MLIDILKKIPDHRRPEGGEYYLHHILLFSILGLLSGSQGYKDLERFMQTHFEKLKSIFKLKWRRVPDYSAIRKIIIGVHPRAVTSNFSKNFQ